MRSRAESLGPLTQQRIDALLDKAEIQSIVQHPFRRLRNGWFHLGLGDIASQLPDNPTMVAPIAAYTGLELAQFAALVENGLEIMSHNLGSWLAVAGKDGAAIKEHLKAPLR